MILPDVGGVKMLGNKMLGDGKYQVTGNIRGQEMNMKIDISK